jgi:hypothetical protein
VIVCSRCGAEVWWGFPRPEDPCYECGGTIGATAPPKGTAPVSEGRSAATERRELVRVPAGRVTFAAPIATRCLSTCTGAHTIPCALPAGHDGPHRSSPSLSWHDPPRVFVGGERYEPDSGDVTFSWERA